MKQDPTEDSTIHETMFGFCSQGTPDLDKHTCPGMYQKSYTGQVKQGRRKVDGIIYLDEYYKCACLCHIPEDERPKTRKKTAKKAVRRNTRRKK